MVSVDEAANMHIKDEGQEVVVELSPTERKLAEGTVGLGAQVCFMRQHEFGVFVKMVGTIRLMTQRKVKGRMVNYAVITLLSKPEQMVRRVVQ